MMAPTPTPLSILFVTPECAPWVKTGGLGDVSAALPKALARLGHEVRVLMPAYRPLRAMLPVAKRRHVLAADGPWPEATLAEVATDGLRLLLLDCPGFYDRAGGPYADPGGLDFEDALRRFAFLADVAARVASGEVAGPAVDVLHANDWPTGLAPAFLRQRQPEPRTLSVFTVHNLAFQGMFPMAQARSLGLPDAWMQLDGLRHWDQVCLLKGGLRFADVVTTVSPTYAQEIQTPEAGCGLDGVLRERAADVAGILNGIDTAEWNPATDGFLAAPYGSSNLAAKRINRLALQREAGLDAEGPGVLFGLVSRLTDQKGVDLVLEVVPWLVAEGHQLVLLGKGDAGLEARWLELAARHPGRVAVTLGFDEGRAHRIEAGADVFLMPSRFEPCGLNQMYSHAYGTLPVVRRTGGLADSVVDVDLPDGNGIVFDAPTADGLREAMARAARLFADAPAWEAVQRRAMALDRGWAASARRYEALYRERAFSAASPAAAPRP